MFDSPEHADKVNGKIPSNLDKPVWGAVEIGKIINRNPRQTHHLLTRAEIKSAPFAPSRPPTGVKAVHRALTHHAPWIVIGSDHDSEVVATARTIGRVPQRAGHRSHDLMNALLCFSRVPTRCASTFVIKKSAERGLEGGTNE